MLFMQDKAKERGCYVQNPNEQEVTKMNSYVSKYILRLSSNPRAEQFTWSTHLKNFARHEKSKKRARN